MAIDLTPMAQNFGKNTGGGGSGNFLTQIFSGLGNLFNDRDFIQYMAQVGTELSPEGMGGKLGRPASAWAERDAAQEMMGSGLIGPETVLSFLGGGGEEQPQDKREQTGQSGVTTPSTAAAGTRETARDRSLLPEAASQRRDERSGLEPPDFEAVLDNILGTLFPQMGGK